MHDSMSGALTLDTNAPTVAKPKRKRVDGPEAFGRSGPNIYQVELKVNDPKNGGSVGSGT